MNYRALKKPNTPHDAWVAGYAQMSEAFILADVGGTQIFHGHKK